MVEPTQMSGIMLDGNGLALVITAICTGIVALATGIGTLIMQWITWKDARELKLEAAELKRLSMQRDGQIKEVKDLVNGRQEQLQNYIAKDSYEKGREHERVAPGTPSPIVGVHKIQMITTDVPTEGIPVKESQGG